MSKAYENPEHLRSDAKRKRGQVLDAARELFASRGADVSLEAIAKQADVGIGTLYRHFPTRADLLAAVSDDQLFALSAESLAREAKLGTLPALRAYLEDIVHHSTLYRGLANSLGLVLATHSPGCQACTAEGQRLLASAQTQGLARADISFDDMICMATAMALAAAETAATPDRAARLVTMFLEGVQTRG